MLKHLHIYVRNVPLLDPIPASFAALQTYVPSSSIVKFLMLRDGFSTVPPWYFSQHNETCFAVPFDTFTHRSSLSLFPLTLHVTVCVLVLLHSLFMGLVTGTGFSKLFKINNYQ